MSRRFGRNQKRRMRAEVETAQQAQRTAEKRANNARDRELYAKRELDEVRHGLDYLVRAVDAAFPELLAFSGREIRHVEYVSGGFMRVQLRERIGPGDHYARVTDPHFTRAITTKDVPLTQFYSIIERDEVRGHLGTLIHFFAKSERNGGSHTTYCVSDDALRYGMAPHAIQQLTMDAAREALRQTYDNARRQVCGR